MFQLKSLFRAGARSANVSMPFKRRFGAAAHPKPEYKGAEAFFRRFLPEDHHLVIFFATIEFGGLFLFIKTRGGGEVEEKVKPVVQDSSDTTIPSMASEEFEDWSKIPGNMEKWEESIEPWAEALTE